MTMQMNSTTLHLHPSPAHRPVNSRHRLSDTRHNKSAAIIGWILRGGAVLSATIIFLGMVLTLVHGGPAGQSFQAFPHTLNQVLLGVLVLQPEAVIALGILLLIATPVITVTTSAVAFALEHDRRFAVIALIVLAVLLTSFLLGKGAA